jgi:hypothetical protein
MVVRPDPPRDRQTSHGDIAKPRRMEIWLLAVGFVILVGLLGHLLNRVVYMVTHKHRLRDCRGTLTFTRNGLRFDSDEPQDSFDVRRDDVTINGDVLRIRDKEWRFEFSDGVRGERLFSDWKAGTLPPATAP